MNSIFLLVDYGYAFDYLAILQVKKRRIGSELSCTNFHKCSDLIKIQIGESLFFDIVNSDEYINLVSINDQIFNLVESARDNKVTAKYVDQLNTLRFEAKKILQRKFFPEILTQEEKNVK